MIFTALLAVTYWKRLFVMISSDLDNAPGTVYYGISMTVMAVCSLFFDRFVFAFGVAVFCTSIGDGFAGVIGALIKRFNPKIYKNKSFFGTLSAFFFSFASVLLFSYLYEIGLTALDAVLIALLASGVELISEFGFDNVTLPMGTAVLTYLLMRGDSVMEYIVPIVLTPFVIAMASSLKLLTQKGIFIAVMLDLAVSVSLGNFGFVLLLSFLILSVLIDKFKKLRKQKDDITKKTGARDSAQVIANGIIPAVFALLYLVTNEFIFVLAFSTALAECFADTVASGLGMLSRWAFDPFRMRRVQIGMSGGMSLLGTSGSLVLAFAFLMIPLAFYAMPFELSVVCALCACAGALTDSMLGSLLQAKYRCKKCTSITEKEEHCKKKTVWHSGLKFIDNDLVNLFGTIFAAGVAFTVYIILM